MRNLRRRVNAEVQRFAYNLQVVRGVGRPAVFQVELTNRCPMTCGMCPRTHSMHRALGDMTREVYLRVLDEAALSTPRFHLHHFGDSLLHPDLGWFIAEATARHIRTHLSANPVLLTAQRIRAVVDSGLDELVLSLDGVTPETSEAVRGKAARNVALAERRVRELIAYRDSVASSRPRVILQIVEQRQNAHEIDEWLRRWRAQPGIHRLKVKSYITWNGAEQAINDLRLRPAPPAAHLVCDKPWTSVTVLWDGRVVPCCFDHDGLLAMGSVREQSLRDIWRGDAFRQLRRQHRDHDLGGLDLCRNCVDKEGFPVRRWTYPLNRLRGAVRPLAAETDRSDRPRRPQPGHRPR